MPLTWGEAKILVAKAYGKHADTDELSVAEDAIRAAIRDLNQRHCWEWKLVQLDNLVLDGSEWYEVASTDGNVQKIFSVYPSGNGTAWKFIRLRTALRKMAGQAAVLSGHYTTRAQSDGTLQTRFFGGGAGEMVIWAYLSITESGVDADNIDVPDQFLQVVLVRAKYHYMLDKDAEGVRTSLLKQESLEAISAAINDDQEKPDEDFGLLDQEDGSALYGALTED